MDSVDIEVLRSAQKWMADGHRVTLATIVKTWGSAPRPVGALLVIRDDGLVSGSVSGGCVEDDLIEKVKAGGLAKDKPAVTTYGVTNEEANRWGLPCGGTLQLVIEPVADVAWVTALSAAIARREPVARRLDLSTGRTQLETADVDQSLFFNEHTLVAIYGPRWRLALIGASEVSHYLAQMGLAFDYEILVCDPREEYRASWHLSDVPVASAMTDDFVMAIKPDARTIILTLSHDPKHDDLALLEALKSNAFYVGAMGSRATNAKRRERLALFDLTPAQIRQLKGPIGLVIGSRTPPEIALAILGELTALRNGIELVALNSDTATAVHHAAA